MKGVVMIERVVTATAEMKLLVGELDTVLFALYPPAQSHGLSIDAIVADPAVRFFIARVDGDAAGCGAIKVDGERGELKRMFVREKHRRRGVAQRMIAHLHEWAKDHGLKQLVLETGELQIEAVSLYQRCGYVRCDAFEPYASMAPDRICSSVFMRFAL
jgi:putative acetyltransferase